jgi:hypothetical protein
MEETEGGGGELTGEEVAADVEAELAEGGLGVGLPVGGADRGGEVVDEPVLRAGEAGAGEGGLVSMNW